MAKKSWNYLLTNQKAKSSNPFLRLENILDEKDIYCKHGIKSASGVLGNWNAQIEMKGVREVKSGEKFQDYKKTGVPFHSATKGRNSHP